MQQLALQRSGLPQCRDAEIQVENPKADSRALLAVAELRAQRTRPQQDRWVEAAVQLEPR
jgi:hypothetical protein